jgi:hypothetical protein
MGGDVADASNGDPQEGLRPEEGGQGLGDEEVEERGEGAALPDACVPLQVVRLDTIGVDRCKRLVQDDHRPGHHAFRGAHLPHGGVEEPPVDGVESFCDIKEENGAGHVIGEEDVGQEVGESQRVIDAAAWQEGSLLKAERLGENPAIAVGQGLAKDSILCIEQGDGPPRRGEVWGRRRLGKACDGASSETSRRHSRLSDGREESGEDWSPRALSHPPQRVGDAAGPW